MGALYCLASAVGFGVMAVFAKLAYDDGVSVESLLLVRFGLAGAALLAIAGARGALRRVTRRGVVVGLAMGAIGYAAQSSLYFAALTHTDASLVALVFCVYPLLVMVVATLIGRDRPSVRRGAAVVTAFAGVALVLGTGSSFSPVGAALALGAALVYTGYILVGDRVVGDTPPLALAALVCCGGAATFLVTSLPGGGPDLSFAPVAWVWLAAIALLGTVGAIVLFFAGIARVGPSVGSLLSIVEPVVTVGSAALVFGEALSVRQALGGLLVLAAVLAVQWPARAAAPVPAEAVVPAWDDVPDADLDPDLDLEPVGV